MNNNDKLLAAISLCRKAGKLVKGFDAVQESVYRGKAVLVLLAADVSDGTAKRMGRTCEDLVDCLRMPLTQLELFCYDGYAWAIVCQHSFSERVKEALPQAKDPDAFYAEEQN